MWTDKQQTWEESEKRKETLQPPVTPSATLQQLNLSYGPMVFLSQAQSEAPGQGLLDRADALSTELDEKNQAELLKRG